MINRIKKYFKQVESNTFMYKLMKNTITITVGTGVTSFLNIINVFITVAFLGSYNYGVLALAESYMLIIDGLLNFQSWQGVIKYGTEEKERSDFSALAAVFKAGFFIDIVTAVIGTGAALFLSSFVVKIMGWPCEITSLLWIFSIEILVHINGTSTGIFRIYDKFNYMSIHSICMTAIKSILLIISLLVFKIDFYTFVIIYVGLDILRHLSFFLLALFVLEKELGLRWVLTRRLGGLNKKFWNYMVWSNLDGTLDIPYRYFDVFLLSLISVQTVAVYKVFKKILDVFNLLVTPFSSAIMPQFGELVAQGKQEKAFAIVMKIRNKILKYSIPLIVIFYVCTTPLIKIFLEDIYVRDIFIFYLLGIIQVYSVSYIAIHSYFAIIGKVKESAAITFFSNILYFVLAVIFLRPFQIYAVIMARFIMVIVGVELKRKECVRYLSKLKTIGGCYEDGDHK